MTFERTTDKQKILDYGYAAIIKQGKPGVYVDGCKVSCTNYNEHTGCVCLVGAFVPREKRGSLKYSAFTDVLRELILPDVYSGFDRTDIETFVLGLRMAHDNAASIAAKDNGVDNATFINQFKINIEKVCVANGLKVPT